MVVSRGGCREGEIEIPLPAGFPPAFAIKSGAPAVQALAGGRASMGRADTIRPYGLSVRPTR